ncbi:molybdopterin-dependent oxidoreductase [Desulfuribacillus alkaliarsenatis]|nr:molybdopterin-dependent oxidoreductase [Desulfuribacillus alkaliarsenatis]
MDNLYKKHSVCSLDCPDTCGLEITLDENNIIRKVEGDKSNPITRGFICNKVRNLANRIHHPERIYTPLKRVGKKGEGKFLKITWEQAIEEIYNNFNECIRKYGGESILPYSYAGTMGIINNSSMDRRFFHKLGASKLERTICSSAGSAGYAYTMGENKGINPEASSLAEYIIIWGTNLVNTNIHQMEIINRARKNGAKVVVIDVHRNKTAELADWFIQLKPATDGALALGIMNVLINNNLVDKNFINKYTYGYTELKQMINLYTPEKVAKITGVAVTDIVQLATEYGSNKKSFIRIGNGFQHHFNGGMATRNITCLPALTGAWQYKGCGALKSNSEYFKINKKKLELLELETSNNRTINMNQLGDALTTLSNPSIHALFIYSSNPVIVAPNQSQIIKGLEREDLFTVVHEIFMTDTAKYADIILPAPTSLEYIDVYRSYWHLYLQLSDPVMPLKGECLQNTELFRRLAKRFGFNDDCFNNSDDELISQALEGMIAGKTGEQVYSYLKQYKIIKIAEESDYINNKLLNLKTSSGKIELYSNQLRMCGLDPLPNYIDITNYTKEDIVKYPLVLVNAPNERFLNSSLANVNFSFEDEPILEIHCDDANARNIEDLDIVTVYNSLGECKLRVRISDKVQKGNVVSLGLWWNSAYKSGTNLNQLVCQELSDIGNGPVFFSTFVQVQKSNI